MERRSDVPVEHTPFSTPPAPDSRALLDADIKPRALDSTSPTASDSQGNHGTAKNTSTTDIRHATQAERDQGTNGTESADELVFDVRLTRGPTGGIGLVYNRSDPAHGAYRVENMVVGGAAETSKLLWVDDVIHHVEGVRCVADPHADGCRAVPAALHLRVALDTSTPTLRWTDASSTMRSGSCQCAHLLLHRRSHARRAERPNADTRQRGGPGRAAGEAAHRRRAGVGSDPQHRQTCGPLATPRRPAGSEG